MILSQVFIIVCVGYNEIIIVPMEDRDHSEAVEVPSLIFVRLSACGLVPHIAEQ